MGIGVEVGTLVEVGIGVGVAVGVAVGVGVGFKTTPLFQTNFLPDLVQV